MENEKLIPQDTKDIEAKSFKDNSLHLIPVTKRNSFYVFNQNSYMEEEASQYESELNSEGEPEASGMNESPLLNVYNKEMEQPSLDGNAPNDQHEENKVREVLEIDKY
jgi:hypothetical protein